MQCNNNSGPTQDILPADGHVDVGGGSVAQLLRVAAGPVLQILDTGLEITSLASEGKPHAARGGFTQSGTVFTGIGLKIYSLLPTST